MAQVLGILGCLSRMAIVRSSVGWFLVQGLGLSFHTPIHDFPSLPCSRLTMCSVWTAHNSYCLVGRPPESMPRAVVVALALLLDEAPTHVVEAAPEFNYFGFVGHQLRSWRLRSRNITAIACPIHRGD